MEFINSTRMPAAATMGLEPSGRELLVVVVKGTFSIPATGAPVRLADEQVPLVMADTFTGEPGYSAPIFEADFAPRKPFCDVLLNGSAYAPDRRPVTRLNVGLRVNGITKTFSVVGDRVWRLGVVGLTATIPARFDVMPISYDRAFGGVDNSHEDPARHSAFMRNPVGRGYRKNLDAKFVDGTPLPNTEELNRPITAPNDDGVTPMSFGPVGRSWQPRLQLAGTYDDAWLRDDFPFLPADFDDRHYQAAPLDQQIPHPQGGEEVVLVNLTPNGQVAFTLPIFNAPIHFFPKNRDQEDGTLVLDTIVIEPDNGRFMLTWRATRPLRKSFFELRQVLVGRKSNEWWATRHALEFPLVLTEVPIEEEPDTDGPSDSEPEADAEGEEN